MKTENSRPTVAQVMPLVLAYYAKKGNGAGGNLHIVLDDGNIRNGNVEFCLERAKEAGDNDGIKVAELMLRMSKRGRYRLYAEKHNSRWRPTENLNR